MVLSMLDMLRRSKVLIYFLVLLNVSTLVANSPIRPDTETVNRQSYFAGHEGKVLAHLFDEDGIPIFERFRMLFDEIESGVIDDVCTPDDWRDIERLLFYLGKDAFLPGATEEENLEIRKDAEELFSEEYFDSLSGQREPDFYCSNYTGHGKQASAFAPCNGGGKSCHAQKNVFSKSFKSSKKFIKKHKKAIIITTAVVLVVGVAAVVIIGSGIGVAAAAGGAAGATISKGGSNSSAGVSDNSSNSDQYGVDKLTNIDQESV